jgi:hypothetical protein
MRTAVLAAAACLLLAVAVAPADAKDWHKRTSSRHRHHQREGSLWRHAEDSAQAFEKVVR